MSDFLEREGGTYVFSWTSSAVAKITAIKREEEKKKKI